MSEATTYLNLGCGSRYHPDWINIDIRATGPGVIVHNLSRGIPLPDASCAVVHHAAVLEHMRRADAAAFMGECYRVLKPGGIVPPSIYDASIPVWFFDEQNFLRRFHDSYELVADFDSFESISLDWLKAQSKGYILRKIAN